MTTQKPPDLPDPDDTQGHKLGNSDRNIKENVHPIQHNEPYEPDDEDVKGHARRPDSDRNIKEDVHPIQHEDEPGEGSSRDVSE